MDPRYFSLGLALQDQVPNPFFGQIEVGALSGPTVARSQLLRPYPDYLNVMTFANHGAASTYHSLQLLGERRYSNGLSAAVTYTASKLINDSFSRVRAVPPLPASSALELSIAGWSAPSIRTTSRSA